jgi:ArsR family transcriptional regulator
LNDSLYELQSGFCSTFSSPKRLEIMNVLRDRELTVSGILEKMSISKTNLSQHLAVMKNQGVVETRREGQHICYFISNPKILQAYDLIQEVLVELMDKKLATLK